MEPNWNAQRRSTPRNTNATSSTNQTGTQTPRTQGLGGHVVTLASPRQDNISPSVYHSQNTTVNIPLQSQLRRVFETFSRKKIPQSLDLFQGESDFIEQALPLMDYAVGTLDGGAFFNFMARTSSEMEQNLGHGTFTMEDVLHAMEQKLTALPDKEGVQNTPKPLPLTTKKEESPNTTPLVSPRQNFFVKRQDGKRNIPLPLEMRLGQIFQTFSEKKVPIDRYIFASMYECVIEARPLMKYALDTPEGNDFFMFMAEVSSGITKKNYDILGRLITQEPPTMEDILRAMEEKLQALPSKENISKPPPRPQSSAPANISKPPPHPQISAPEMTKEHGHPQMQLSALFKIFSNTHIPQDRLGISRGNTFVMEARDLIPEVQGTMEGHDFFNFMAQCTEQAAQAKHEIHGTWDISMQDVLRAMENTLQALPLKIEVEIKNNTALKAHMKAFSKRVFMPQTAIAPHLSPMGDVMKWAKEQGASPAFCQLIHTVGMGIKWTDQGRVPATLENQQTLLAALPRAIKDLKKKEKNGPLKIKNPLKKTHKTEKTQETDFMTPTWDELQNAFTKRYPKGAPVTYAMKSGYNGYDHPTDPNEPSVRIGRIGTLLEKNHTKPFADFAWDSLRRFAKDNGFQTRVHIEFLIHNLRDDDLQKIVHDALEKPGH